MTNWNTLEVSRVEHPEAVVYRLSGVLTNNRESYDFLEDVQKSVHQAKRNVVLVLGDVQRITSSGVGILAASYTSTTNAGGRLILAAIPNAVELVLNVVRLLTIIERAPTEAEALARLA